MRLISASQCKFSGLAKVSRVIINISYKKDINLIINDIEKIYKESKKIMRQVGENG